MAVCGSCGESNPERARFCFACGSELGRAPAQTRRTVTILFADIVGSTALAEGMDPEAYRSLIESRFASMQAQIESYGGTVEKFIGDAVMAVFGVPVAHEDDALRAVRAAAAIQKHLLQAGAEAPVRIGINTGEVITGLGGEGRTGIVGDPVNTAARLEKLAPPGGIVLGGETLRLVRASVNCESLGPTQIRGRDAPVETYLLLAVDSMSAQARTYDAPMVGRDWELESLRRALARVTKDGICMIATILGPAGIGKSRLVAELLKDTDNSPRVLSGRCLPYGDGITFWPITETISEAAHISDRDPRAEAIEKVRSLVDPGEGSELVSSVMTQLLNLTPTTAGQEEIFWAVRQVFETLARHEPLVLVFDDIHWGEDTFLDLVDHLAESVRDVPLFIVCMARPELLDARPSWGGGKVNAMTMLVEPLEEMQIRELFGGLLGDTTGIEPVIRPILDAAEGNPFFLEETIAMLTEDNVIEKVDGSWVARTDVSSIALPPTINALLTARLDHLPAEERCTLEVAAVMGKVFASQAVRELDAPTTDTDRALDQLTRKGIIRLDQEEFAGEEMYRFRHLLMRDAAYQGLPKQRRAELHERYADWLVEVLGNRTPEYEEIIGYHLESSFTLLMELRTSGHALEQTRRKAAERLASAGRRSHARGDCAAAISLLSRAAELARPDNGDLRIRIELSEAFMDAARYEEARASLTETLARASGTDVVRTLAAVHLENLLAEIEPNRSVSAMRSMVEQAIEELTAAGELAGLAFAYRFLSYLRDTTGDWSGSNDALKRAIEAAEAAGDERLTNQLRRVLMGSISWGPAPLSEIRTETEAFLEQAEAFGDLRSRARGLSILAMVEAFQGDPLMGRKLIAEQKAIHDQLSMPVAKAWCCFEALWVEVAAGDALGAEAELRSAIAVLDRHHERAVLPTVLALLADVRLEAGDAAEASSLVERARDMAADDDVLTQIKWRSVVAKLLAAKGEQDALTPAREAVDLARATDYLDWQAHAWMDLADVASRVGTPNDVRDSTEHALDLYERKEMTVMAERTRAKLGSLARLS